MHDMDYYALLSEFRMMVVSVRAGDRRAGGMGRVDAGQIAQSPSGRMLAARLGLPVPERGPVYQAGTLSGNPIAVAAGLATLELYRTEGIFERAASLESYWADAVHSLRGLPHVIDLRNIGIVAGIELEPRPGAAGARAFELFLKCFEAGLMIRSTGDTLALSPPLIVERAEIDRMFETVASTLRQVA